MPTAEIILDELVKITGTEEVRSNLDLALFEDDVLDSIGFGGINCGPWRTISYRNIARPGGPTDVGYSPQDYRRYRKQN